MDFFIICLSNNFNRDQSFASEEGEDHIGVQEEEPGVDGQAQGQEWTKYFSQTKIDFNTKSFSILDYISILDYLLIQDYFLFQDIF